MRWIKRLNIGLGVLCVFGAALWVWGMPNSATRGVWKAEADGSYLTFSPFTARLYHANAADCTETLTFPAHLPLVKAIEGASVDVAGDTLTLSIAATIDTPTYRKVDALPNACTIAGSATPQAVFDMAWQAMADHYAFFDLYGVDWEERRALRPDSDQTLSDAQLFDLLQQMLAGLNDGHIQLIAGELGYFSPKQEPNWTDHDDVGYASTRQLARETFGGPLNSVDDTWVDYGLREDGLGYVLLSGMWIDMLFSGQEPAKAQQIAAEIALALQDAAAIIVDIRHNGGGSDGTSLAYASVFTDTEQLVLTKRTKMGDDWTAPSQGILRPHPDGHHLSQPIYLLTSGYTASAAEIFTMALRDLPQVTVIGESTSGGLSDILGLTLPNGWQFGLSNQEYRTADGNLYEGPGIPPDIEITMDGEALAQGTDVVLEAAIAMALGH